MNEQIEGNDECAEVVIVEGNASGNKKPRLGEVFCSNNNQARNSIINVHELFLG